MRMSKESQRPRRCEQTGKRLIGRENVFVFIFHGTVYKNHAVCFDWATRQAYQIPQILRRKLGASPFDCRASHGVELFRIRNTADGLIVVASYDGADQRTDSLDHLVRIRSVAYHVPQAYRMIPTPCTGLERRFERGRVRVHVAENQQAHGEPPETAAGRYEL